MTTENAVSALSLAVLVALAALVIRPFFPALAWAAVIAYATWPVRCWLERRVPFAGLQASLMTLLVIALLLLPVALVSIALQREISAAVEGLENDALVEHVFDALRMLPWIGDSLAERLHSLLQIPDEIGRQAIEWLRDRVGRVFVIAGGVGRGALLLLLMFLTLFFMYRDGDGWIARIEQIAQRLFGKAGLDYLVTVREATRAVVYGLLVTMLAQGTTAGMGFWFAGVPAPTLLALATAIFALLPFGPALPIGAAVVWLALSGSIFAAVGLALWGTLAVGLIDNLLRPLVMARGLQVHYLVAMFGVLGGLMLFGLIGVFIGPIVLAVLASLLRSRLGERAPRDGGGPRIRRAAR